LTIDKTKETRTEMIVVLNMLNVAIEMVSYKKQELLTLCERLSSPSFF